MISVIRMSIPDSDYDTTQIYKNGEMSPRDSMFGISSTVHASNPRTITDHDTQSPRKEVPAGVFHISIGGH